MSGDERGVMSRAVGDKYEQLAGEFLCANGCEIVATNYVVANIGEIDIIARLDKSLPNGRVYPTLLCVEVRARQHKNFASAAETVTKTKQKRLIATMGHFLQTFESYKEFDVRFDVLAFKIDEGEPQVEWICGAFLAD